MNDEWQDNASNNDCLFPNPFLFAIHNHSPSRLYITSAVRNIIFQQRILAKHNHNNRNPTRCHTTGETTIVSASKRQIALSLDMAFGFVYTAAPSDLRAQRIFNFCAHKVTCFLATLHHLLLALTEHLQVFFDYAKTQRTPTKHRKLFKETRRSGNN